MGAFIAIPTQRDDADSVQAARPASLTDASAVALARERLRRRASSRNP
jgi:hypothetical protein